MAHVSRFILPFALASLSCLAVTPEEVDAYPTSKKLNSLVYANSFDTADSLPANLTPGYAFAPAAGCNGTGAISYTRTDPQVYNMQLIKVEAMDQSLKYNAQVYVRAEGIATQRPDKNLGLLCVEFYRDGKWCGGTYYDTNTVKIGKDWQKLSLNLNVPPHTEAYLNLYLKEKCTGKIWFDDLSLRTSGIDTSFVLNSPKALALETKSPACTFTVVPKPDRNSVLLLTAFNNGKTQRTFLREKDGRYHATLNDLTPGPVTLTATLADTQAREKTSIQTYRLVARPPQTPPANACRIGDDGRAYVAGKAFMPIGVYGYANDQDLEELAGEGFNCLITYGSLNLYGEKKTGDRIRDIRAGLDRFQKHGIKCIFAIKNQFNHKPEALRTLGNAKTPAEVTAKVVQNLKDHPALLCWYINDEEPRDKIPEVLKLREIVSAIDPWHPTWTLTYRNGDFPYCGISGDIMGTDLYMFDKKPTQNVENVVTGMKASMSTGQAVWIVPQSFNWRVYRTSDPKVVADGHFPTANEILAHTMIGVIHGAKGFIFYSQFDVKYKTERLIPGSFRLHWPKTVASAQMLHKLEPYIMSGKPIRQLKVRQTGKEGIVEAAALTDLQDRQAIIIISEHTHAAGTVTMPDGSTIDFAPGQVDASVIFR